MDYLFIFSIQGAGNLTQEIKIDQHKEIRIWQGGFINLLFANVTYM